MDHNFANLFSKLSESAFYKEIAGPRSAIGRAPDT